MSRILKVLSTALWLNFAPAAYGQAAIWTISEAAGPAAVSTASGTAPARRGATVPAGATLSIGPAARAVVVRGRNFMTLAANSRVREALPAGGVGNIGGLSGNGSGQPGKNGNQGGAGSNPNSQSNGSHGTELKASGDGNEDGRNNAGQDQ